MKAFILAAGLGTRLKPLTDTTCKPMLPIDNKPLLEYHIELLKKYGIKDIAINLYYFPEKIKEYFQDGSKFGVNILYIEEKELSGTAGPIKKNENFFDEPFVVIYGDNLTNINLDKLYKFHQEKNATVSIALYEEPHPESKGIVLLDKNKKVTKFKEKPKTEEIDSHLANAGIYICDPQILKYIPKNKFYDFGHDLFPQFLEKNIPMFGYEMNEFLLDIGTHETYKKAQDEAKRIKF